MLKSDRSLSDDRSVTSELIVKHYPELCEWAARLIESYRLSIDPHDVVQEMVQSFLSGRKAPLAVNLRSYFRTALRWTLLDMLRGEGRTPVPAGDPFSDSLFASAIPVRDRSGAPDAALTSSEISAVLDDALRQLRKERPDQYELVLKVMDHDRATDPPLTPAERKRWERAVETLRSYVKR